MKAQWPNPRLQRTRSASPPSPLSRQPLGRPRLAGAASALALVSVTTFGSIVARPAERPDRNTRPIRDDAIYEFVFRHYGSSRDPRGNTEPGLFVRSKATNRWIEITAVSTKDGRFGSSESDSPEDQKVLRGISVGWNFGDLASKPFAELPLRTSGSIAFPDQIEDDAAGDRYRLRFMSQIGIASAESVLYVDKADLKAAFEVAREKAK